MTKTVGIDDVGGLRGRIGIFGGSFDPPHDSHRRAMVAAVTELELDVVLMLLAASPAGKHKGRKKASDVGHRLELCQQAVSEWECPQIIVCTAELELMGESAEALYTVDVLEKLAEAGLRRPWLIVGADQAGKLERWRNAEKLAGLAHIAGVTRVGYPRTGPVERWIELKDSYLASTALRAQIAGDGDVSDVSGIPAGVVALIAQRGLYRGSAT